MPINLATIQAIVGPPKRERNTVLGKTFQRILTGSNFQSSTGQQPAAAVQNRPLASGNISFGTEQRNRNLLNVAGLVALVLILWRFFQPKRKRR